MECKEVWSNLARATREEKKPENQRCVAGKNIKFQNLIQDVANSRIINLICMRRHEICVFPLRSSTFISIAIISFHFPSTQFSPFSSFSLSFFSGLIA
jgi:hypothetical protein